MILVVEEFGSLICLTTGVMFSHPRGAGATTGGCACETYQAYLKCLPWAEANARAVRLLVAVSNAAELCHATCF